MGSVDKRPVPPGPAPARRRGPTTLRASRAAVGCYLLGRTWQLLFLGRPIVAPDTPMYRSADQRWLDFPGSNFLGHALRPWPITLLYSVAPTDAWRIFAQFVIGTCCWGFCIWQLGRLTRNRTGAATGAFVVAALALSIGVSGFDAILLSESLTLSLVALYVGAVLSLCGGRGRLPTMGTAFVAAALLALLRPVLIPLVPGVALVAYLVRFRPRVERRRAAGATVVVVAAMSLGAMGYAWSVNVQIDKTWGGWRGVPGLNGRTLTQYYLVVHHTPSGPALLEAMIDAGAPACLRPNPPAVAGDVSRDFVNEDHLRCPQGQAWLSGHFLAALATHLATHPAAARRYFADALGDESMLRAEGHRSVPNVVPGPLTNVFFSRQRGFGDPLVLWSMVGFGLVSASSIRPRRSRPRPWSNGPRDLRVGCRRLMSRLSPLSALEVCTACILLAGYVALAGTALLSATDASRVALPVTVLIRLILVVVIVRGAVPLAELAAPPLARRWRGRPRGGRAAAGYDPERQRPVLARRRPCSPTAAAIARNDAAVITEPARNECGR
jgi:hypothetical protein